MSARGRHITLDYSGFTGSGEWVLSLLRDAVSRSEAREVHSHVSVFNGIESPAGFAAVVLIDESHVSAHCYSEQGLLAIDVFTCGEDNPEPLADSIHASLSTGIPGLRLTNRKRVERFLEG
ncbi:MAG TPA: hypothetical protein EYQ80_04285 [Candidatus Poseidoniales archaeon]|nr:hypothetical protein [Candidatus Poseidoniales archaeon]